MARRGKRTTVFVFKWLSLTKLYFQTAVYLWTEEEGASGTDPLTCANRDVGANVRPMTCPKCAFEQDEGEECLRCGIIFKKYKPLSTPSPPLAIQETESENTLADEKPLALKLADTGDASQKQAEKLAREEEPEEFWEPDPEFEESNSSVGIVKTVTRIFPWIALAAGIGAIYLIFQQAPPLQIQIDPHALQRVDRKMEELQIAAQRGEPYTLNMDESELNAWLKASIELAGGETGNQVRGVAPDIQVDDPQFQEAQSSMKDLQVKLSGDQLRAYALFDFKGQNLSLILAGRIHVVDGYLRLDPTEAKIGSLPIPQMTLDGVVKRLFESEQNREAFHLPAQISNVDIRHGNLYVFYQ